MDRSEKMILVTGARGTQGGAVAYKLLEAGFKVRALVFRSECQNLRDAGAEIVRGNFDEVESLVKAMEGVYGVFSMQNLDLTDGDAESHHAKNLVDAALKAGVKQIVHASVTLAGNHEEFPDWGTGRWHEKYWLAKYSAMQIVINAGFEYWTVLKPATFMENFLQSKASFMHPSLKQGQILNVSRPETKRVFVAAEDIASFATAAFKDPQSFNRKMIDIASETLNLTEVADILSKVLGKKIRAVHLSKEEALAKGMPPNVIAMGEWYDEVRYVLDVELLKQYNVPLTSFEDWARKHKDEFLVEV